MICVKVPLHRLELCSSAPEADALSTELQGRAEGFYHICFHVIASRRRHSLAPYTRTGVRRHAVQVSNLLIDALGDCHARYTHSQ